MGKFDIFNTFNNAVLVVGKNMQVVFKNYLFNKFFPDFSTIEKFSHKLNFESCNLDSDYTSMYSPIYQAIFSPQNFF